MYHQVLFVLKVDLVDINYDADGVEEMHYTTENMMVLSVLFPFVLD